MTKESVCIDILRSGHVNAFVDFFYLSHRADPNPGELLCSHLPPRASPDISTSEKSFSAKLVYSFTAGPRLVAQLCHLYIARPHVDRVQMPHFSALQIKLDLTAATAKYICHKLI